MYLLVDACELRVTLVVWWRVALASVCAAHVRLASDCCCVLSENAFSFIKSGRIYKKLAVQKELQVFLVATKTVDVATFLHEKALAGCLLFVQEFRVIHRAGPFRRHLYQRLSQRIVRQAAYLC